MLKRGKMDRDVVEIVGIDSLVPKEHLLRKIDKAVDFNRLYEMVEPLSHNNTDRQLPYPDAPYKSCHDVLPNSVYFAIRPCCLWAGTICGSTGEQNQFYARARSGKKSRPYAVHLYFTMPPYPLHLVFIHRGASI